MKLSVRLDIDVDVDPRIHDLYEVDNANIKAAVLQAISDALYQAWLNGYNHHLTDYISLDVTDVSLIEKSRRKSKLSRLSK